METTEIVDKIKNVSRDVFDNSELEITLVTKMSEIEGWDSLAQINLYSSIEKEFSIRFSIVDMEKMNSVATIVDVIRGKL